MDKIAKAKQIVAFVERVKEQNRLIEQIYPHDNRRDYNYTSYAWALNVLKGVIK